MSAVIAEPAVGRRSMPTESGRLVTPVAWLTIVVVSAAPAAILALVTGTVPRWLAAISMVMPGALAVASLLVTALRPLLRFALALLALLGLLLLLPRLEFAVPALQNALGGTAFDARMQAEQTGKLLVSLAMIGVLLALGYRRRDFFLAMGDLSAPIRPVRTLAFPHADPWWKFGLIWGFGIAAGLAIALYMSGSSGVPTAVLPMVPSIVVYAALNAFTEEMTYRAPFLATLEPAVGSSRALAMTAVFFGVAHYFGTPGGLVGAVLATFMGWILGKAMVETRGMFWSWFIHFLSDVVIFVFIAASLAG